MGLEDNSIAPSPSVVNLSVVKPSFAVIYHQSISPATDFSPVFTGVA
jgi:hypothetical protein